MDSGSQSGEFAYTKTSSNGEPGLSLQECCEELFFLTGGKQRFSITSTPSETNLFYHEKTDTSSSAGKHSSCRTRVDDMISKSSMRKLPCFSIETYIPEKNRKIL